MRNSALLRFAGSLGVALCIVVAMLWFGVEVSGFADREPQRVLETQDVTLLSETELLDLWASLGEGRGRVPTLSRPTRVSPPVASAEIRGFVRLDVGIDAEGRVADVRVIDASPPGIFETQAVADVRVRRYSPEVVDGVAVASRRLEIVDFTVAPAAQSRAGRE